MYKDCSQQGLGLSDNGRFSIIKTPSKTGAGVFNSLGSNSKDGSFLADRWDSDETRSSAVHAGVFSFDLIYSKHARQTRPNSAGYSVATVHTFLPHPPYPTHLCIPSAASVLASISLRGPSLRPLVPGSLHH